MARKNPKRNRNPNQPLKVEGFGLLPLPPVDKVRLVSRIIDNEQCWDYGIFKGVAEAVTYSRTARIAAPSKFYILNSAGREVHTVERIPQNG